MNPEQETLDAIDDGVDLPYGAALGYVVWTDTTEGTDGEPIDVHALALAFQVEEGGDVMRQVFLIHSEIVPQIIESLTNAPTREEVFSA